MPRNRRARRAFDKKYRSGLWKACAGATAMAAVIASQVGVTPAFAAPTTRYVDLSGEDNGTSALSLREAIALANPGDIIDISGVDSDLYVDGPITIDTELTIVGAGDGVQKIHSYARTASSWGFNNINLGLGDDVDGAGDDFFDNNANDVDTIVGNTIFHIDGQVLNGTEELVESTVTFKDVAISGYALYPGEGIDNIIEEGVYHNYTPLVTVDEDHHGEVIFDGSTLEDSHVTTMAKGFEVYNNNRDNMYVWMANGSGLASYSSGEGYDNLEPTKISFINDSQIYNLSTNLVVDWADQFSTVTGDDLDNLGGGTEVVVTYNWDAYNVDGFDEGNIGGVTVSNWSRGDDESTQSAVFSMFGDIEFINSSAESNSVYTGDANGTWYIDDADGSVFGIYEGNLTVIDSTINDNYNEHGDGGAVYLDQGNLYLSASVDGQSDITYNTARGGEGGAFSLDDGKFEIYGDVVFANNQAENGGAIEANGDGNDYFSFIGEGVEFHNNKAEYDGGAIYMAGWLKINGQFDDGVEFNDNWSYDGAGGAIYQRDGYLEISFTNFDGNDAREDEGNEWGGMGGALFVLTGYESKTSINNVGFVNNYAEYSGGAVAVEQAYEQYDRNDLIINESSFYQNYSGDEGGAVFIDAVVDAKVSDSFFQFNEADEEGGAIYFDTFEQQSEATYFSVIDSTFNINRTDRAGGAIFSLDALNVEGSYFTSNLSDESSGGAIFTSDGGTVKTSYFTGNMADYSGGAIYASDGGALAIYESEFVRNGWDIRGEGWGGDSDFQYTYDDTNNGGAIGAERSDLLIVNSHLEDNFADEEGGAVYSEYSDYQVRVLGSSFLSNDSNNEGSAIYADGDIYVVNSTFSENQANEGDYVIYSDSESVYLAMSTMVNDGESGQDAFLIYASDYVHVFGSILASNNGATGLYLDADGDVYDDGYNLVTDSEVLENGAMTLGTALANKSMYVNWADLDFTQSTISNWGSYAETMKLGSESIAIRYIRGNRVDVEWLDALMWFPAKDDFKTIYELIEDDARGTHRGNLMDVGSFEASIMSGGGGSVDAGPSEPVVEPTPTPTPEALDPVVANVRGFAPGSAVLTKALKATIKAEATKNADYKAVVLRGFTVTAADFALAKARATAVKNYLLKLVPDLATKVLKGKLGQSRKVKLTFKETL